MVRPSRAAASAALAAVAVLTWACSDTPPTSPAGDGPPAAIAFGGDGGTGGSHSPNWLSVCKEGPAGTYEFTVSTTSGANFWNPAGSPFTLVPGECKTVFVVLGDPLTTDPLSTVVVTELGTTPLDSIRSVIGNATPVVITDSRSVTAMVNYATGGVITFFNGEDEPPPPPPGGGEGCTPGYWKQQHHFGNWPSPYVPKGAGATDFDAAFGVNAFTPNMTLLKALGQGGGGLKALGRHAAAALLNSASSGVDYDLTTSEVISLVQAAIASGDYEGAKNRLEGLNEQGCGLGRAD